MQTFSTQTIRSMEAPGWGGRNRHFFMTLTSLERALLRLLVVGYDLDEAALSVGLSPANASAALQELQERCGVSCLSRLLALAILKSWV